MAGRVLLKLDADSAANLQSSRSRSVAARNPTHASFSAGQSSRGVPILPYFHTKPPRVGISSENWHEVSIRKRSAAHFAPKPHVEEEVVSCSKEDPGAQLVRRVRDLGVVWFVLIDREAPNVRLIYGSKCREKGDAAGADCRQLISVCRRIVPSWAAR